MSHTILIVEDEDAIRSALRERMAKEGYTVMDAIDGVQGLELAIEKKPDLIILDIVMPRMHGLDMLARLRQNEWGKTAKVLILTNFQDATKVKKAEEHGVLEYIVKTQTSIEDVLEKVNARLGD